MKYRELAPNEIEAYNIGYKNGSRQAIIKVLEYETPEEKMFYRQGYNAGCQDRKRRNVSTCEIGSNVSNVSNVKSYDSGVSCESCDSTIANNNTITNTIADSKESIGGMGEKREKIAEETLFKAGFQNWVFPVEFRKLAVKHWSEETIREIEKQFSCREYDTETSIKQLLESYPDEKTKKKVAEITNYGQYEYLHPQMDKWLDYKKSRGERYKTEQSLMVCAKKLHELSGGNALIADAIVEQSIASNYAGLFPLKQSASNAPHMSLKDIKEMQKQVEIQKILQGGK
jgi:hypothetical protein